MIGRILNGKEEGDNWLSRDEGLHIFQAESERKVLYLAELGNLGIMSCFVEESDKSGMRNF